MLKYKDITLLYLTVLQNLVKTRKYAGKTEKKYDTTYFKQSVLFNVIRWMKNLNRKLCLSFFS